MHHGGEACGVSSFDERAQRKLERGRTSSRALPSQELQTLITSTIPVRPIGVSHPMASHPPVYRMVKLNLREIMARHLLQDSFTMHDELISPRSSST